MKNGKLVKRYMTEYANHILTDYSNAKTETLQKVTRVISYRERGMITDTETMSLLLECDKQASAENAYFEYYKNYDGLVESVTV